MEDMTTMTTEQADKIRDFAREHSGVHTIHLQARTGPGPADLVVDIAEYQSDWDPSDRAEAVREWVLAQEVATCVFVQALRTEGPSHAVRGQEMVPIAELTV